MRHLVELHGGTVRAESAGAGKGSTFSVTLPLAAVSPETMPPPSAGDLNGKPGVNDGVQARQDGLLRDVTVLVVDDDDGVRDAVAEMLNRSGARVWVAESAAEAMRVVEEFQPDAVLCDIAMPGEDGYSFLKRLRALGPLRGGDIPALALTALAGDGDRVRALAAGFQMHVTKPVDIDGLRQAVVNLVARPTAPLRVPPSASGGSGGFS